MFHLTAKKRLQKGYLWGAKKKRPPRPYRINEYMTGKGCENSDRYVEQRRVRDLATFPVIIGTINAGGLYRPEVKYCG